MGERERGIWKAQRHYIGATGANIEIFYNLIVFTVTFDQYHAAFLNKNFCMVMCLQNLQSKICA